MEKLLPLTLGVDERVDGLLAAFKHSGLRSPTWLLSGAGPLLARGDWQDAFLPITDELQALKLAQSLDEDSELSDSETIALRSGGGHQGDDELLDEAGRVTSCVLLLKLKDTATGAISWALRSSGDLTDQFVLGILVRQARFHQDLLVEDDVESSDGLMSGFQVADSILERISDVVDTDIPVGATLEFLWAFYDVKGADAYYFRAIGNATPTELVGRLGTEARKLCAAIARRTPLDMSLIYAHRAPFQSDVSSSPGSGIETRGQEQRPLQLAEWLQKAPIDRRFLGYSENASELYLIIHIVTDNGSGARWAYRSTSELNLEETLGINYALHAQLLDKSIAEV